VGARPFSVSGDGGGGGAPGFEQSANEIGDGGDVQPTRRDRHTTGLAGVSGDVTVLFLFSRATLSSRKFVGSFFAARRR
jgi:hypothetical protein